MLGVAFKLNHLMGAERLFNAGILALVIGLLSWVVCPHSETQSMSF